MTTTAQAGPLNFRDFDKDGLYLLLDGETRYLLDKGSVLEFAERFLEDPERVPVEIKKSVDFEKCEVCPKRDEPGYCHAIMPALPLVDLSERYLSFDKVTVVARTQLFDQQEPVFQVAVTSMQNALKYVSVLSLMYYCEVGRKYWKYFSWILPLSSVKEIAARFYLNVYWMNGGDRNEVDRIIREFHDEIRITSQCQIKRLKLICKSDSFLNAYVLAQVISELLDVVGEDLLERESAEA
ncbi:MAG TPA: hypothetical protein VLR94_04395 [Acidobacteriota bacterium]|nr:hypothetical protein [Acidobacteriota bacterium]